MSIVGSYCTSPASSLQLSCDYDPARHTESILLFDHPDEPIQTPYGTVLHSRIAVYQVLIDVLGLDGPGAVATYSGDEDGGRWTHAIYVDPSRVGEDVSLKLAELICAIDPVY